MVANKAAVAAGSLHVLRRQPLRRINAMVLWAATAP
jgi:hypothetical protein